MYCRQLRKVFAILHVGELKCTHLWCMKIWQFALRQRPLHFQISGFSEALLSDYNSFYNLNIIILTWVVWVDFLAVSANKWGGWFTRTCININIGLIKPLMYAVSHCCAWNVSYIVTCSWYHFVYVICMWFSVVILQWSIVTLQFSDEKSENGDK